jgi:hypothetical protein
MVIQNLSAPSSRPCTISAPGPAVGQAQVGDVLKHTVDSVVVTAMASAKGWALHILTMDAEFYVRPIWRTSRPS